ncbi:CLD8 protein, partial [Menura novaehollandiae]|nr:CLD8 protein [Menura novaehollandiae]
MGSGALQAVGLLLGGTGVVGTLAVTAMPQWRVSAFIESNIIVFESSWEGLWMHCSRQANIRMHCKRYDSLLALSPDLQVSRGLMCAGSALALLAFLVAAVGMRCLRSSRTAEGCVAPAAGLLFILSGVVELIPVCWVANSIISDFYNPLVNAAQKRELGEALYVGWVAASCLVAAGSVFCCLWCHGGKRGSCGYCPAPSQHVLSKTGSSYSKSQYV